MGDSAPLRKSIRTLRPSTKEEKPVDADDIKKAGSEILVSYKALERAWKTAEEKLSHAHVPEDVKVKVDSICIGPSDNPAGETIFSLGYGKVKGHWKICCVEEELVWGAPEGYDSCTWTPITEASVKWRMEMIKFFPALTAEVVAVTRRFVDDIKKKAADFDIDLKMLDL